jgi:cytochrome b pre-mRNA-processing protein 3
MMFGRFRQSRGAKAIAPALYGAIVAQARSPALYADLGVPDSVEGRFEMIILHAALVLRRLRDGNEQAQEVGQEVFDLFCTDMDRSLRELGVGDLIVPKRMRKMAEAFYGRSAAYGAALAAGELALSEALARNVFTNGMETAPRLAAYVAAVAGRLAAVSPAAILAESLALPAPADFAGAQVS